MMNTKKVAKKSPSPQTTLPAARPVRATVNTPASAPPAAPKAEPLVDLGFLAARTSRAGVEYWKGTLTYAGRSSDVIVFENSYKEEEKHPDRIVYTAVGQGETKRKIGALWQKTDKLGNAFFSGTIASHKVLVFADDGGAGYRVMRSGAAPERPAPAPALAPTQEGGDDLPF